MNNSVCTFQLIFIDLFRERERERKRRELRDPSITIWKSVKELTFLNCSDISRSNSGGFQYLLQPYPKIYPFFALPYFECFYLIFIWYICPLMLDYTLWEHGEMAEQTLPLSNWIKPSPLELSMETIRRVDTSIFDSLGRGASEDQQMLQKLAQVPCIY